MKRRLQNLGPSVSNRDQPSVKSFFEPIPSTSSRATQELRGSVQRSSKQDTSFEALADLYLRSSNVTLHFLTSKPFQEYSAFKTMNYISKNAPEVVAVIFDL